jgi:hypothetical protein
VVTDAECDDAPVAPGYEIFVCSTSSDDAADVYRPIILDLVERKCLHYWFAIDCNVIGEQQDNACELE